jgi:hypothetical protein
MRIKITFIAIFLTGMVYSCGNGNGDEKKADTTETLNNRYEDDTTVNNVNRALDQAVDTVKIKKKDTLKKN